LSRSDAAPRATLKSGEVVLALLRQIFLSILREICSIAGRGTSTWMGETSRALAESLS
jgi:hypothetical protein